MLSHPAVFKYLQEKYILTGLLSAAGFLLVAIAVFLAVNGSTVPASAKAPASVLAQSGFVFVTATPVQRETQIAPVTKEPLNAPPLPTAGATPRPYYADANEMGKVMVLMYHRIGYPESRYQRTPDKFRADLQRLLAAGYYPVNFVDLVQGLKEVPPGKKPVILTFDDSDISQFLVLEDRTVDTNSAMGILLNFHAQYPEDWPLRGTFFVLGDDTANYSKLFGQPEWSRQKLEVLVELGMEIGSHTVNHVDLARVTEERIRWELAVSKHVIEELVPDYTVQTLSVPFGGFPWTTDFLRTGNWEDYGYAYVGNAAAWGGPSVSPFDPEFNPYKIARIEVTDTWIDHWLTYFEQNPDEYYISDGDPGRLTYPEPEQQQIAAEIEP
jgi:peptidoglycan/xylan/chitin deacetylase (PgdA/CDA1 family)